MSRIESILKKQSVVILVGAGGVGKTTSAISVALQAARLGRRVGLLSIDPAKRLAAAMGIPLSGSVSAITLPTDFKSNGSLSAAMLDQQGVFDSMVDRFAPNPKTAEAIKAHSFYHAASQNLAGALEFMALAKLQEMVESEQFDLVVVDTPPDAHALDFLARPDSISRFIDSKVTTWMLKPFAVTKKLGLGSLFSKGEKLMGGIAKIAGFSALQTMSEFLILLQDVMVGFNRAGARVAKTIRSEECSFIVVTAPRTAPVRASINMILQLQEMRLPLDAAIVNRCLPESIRKELSTTESVAKSNENFVSLRKRLSAESESIATLKAEALKYYPTLKTILVDEIPGSIDNLEAIADIAKQM